MSFQRGTTARLSLQRLTQRLSMRSKEYYKVEDMHDTRVPLYNEDVFQHGLKFKAKYIGSLEIPRPQRKNDIITAMRRIRYEFKVKGIRKIRCTLDVSTTGVKVSKRKRKRRRKQYSEEQLFIMQHPIYRVFYVSHDSQEMKIFSYITREVPQNIFRCNVFKAYKKSMALHIVRSLGQAFEVCHKLHPKPQKKKEEGEGGGRGEGEREGREGEGGGEAGKGGEGEGEKGTPTSERNMASFKKLSLEASNSAGAGFESDFSRETIPFQFDPFSPSGSAPNFVPNGSPFHHRDFLSTASSLPPPPPPSSVVSTPMDGQSGALPPQASAAVAMGISRPRPRAASQTSTQMIQENPFTEGHPERQSPVVSIGEPLSEMVDGPTANGELNPFRLSEEPPSSWERERQQMAVQVKLMREQLQAETNSRLEAESRMEHLLLQNKELLSHLQKLILQVQQLQALQNPGPAPNTTAAPPPAPTKEPAAAANQTEPLPPASLSSPQPQAVSPPDPPINSSSSQSLQNEDDPFAPLQSSPTAAAAAAKNDPFAVTSVCPPAVNDPFAPQSPPVETVDPFTPLTPPSPAEPNAPQKTPSPTSGVGDLDEKIGMELEQLALSNSSSPDPKPAQYHSTELLLEPEEARSNPTPDSVGGVGAEAGGRASSIETESEELVATS